MKEKISVKTLYLLGIITIGLIGLGVGSTYAMFTVSAEIDNPISINANLNSEDDIIETINLELEPNDIRVAVINLNNTSNTTLNYASFYITESSDIEVGVTHNFTDTAVPTGSISNGTTKKVYIQIKNSGSSTTNVTLGILSNSGTIIKADNMTLINDTNIDTTSPELLITGQDMIVKDGLIRYYNASNNLEYSHSSNTTTWKDLSGNYDGKVNNVTWNTNNAAFNGTSSNVNIGQIREKEITLEVYFKYETANNQIQYLISNVNDNLGITMLIDSDSRPRIGVYNTEYRYIYGESLAPGAPYYNLTGTYDGTNLKLYLNGILLGTLNVGTVQIYPDDATPMAIGCDPNVDQNGDYFCYSNFFAGTIYSARVYNRVLTEAEIKQNIIADRISSGDNSPNANGTYTIISNKRLSNFTSNNITVTNGTKGTFTKVNDRKYNLNITGVSGSTTMELNIPANNFTDVSGNKNVTATTLSKYMDNTGPIATITKNTSTSRTVTYTFTFHEYTYGFTADDITISEGTKGTFTKIDQKTYTLVVTHSTDGSKTITVNANSCNDLNGNLNTSKSLTHTIDSIKPTVTITKNTSTSRTVTYTFTFSEAVTGFSASSVTVSEGTKGTFTKVSDSKYTLVVTHASDGSKTIKVAAGACKDSAGNGNTAKSLTHTITTDTTKPTITNIAAKAAVNSNTITATLKDNKSLTGYAITTSSTNSCSGTAPTSWTSISGTSYSLSKKVTTYGTHYIWTKDASGNTACSSKAIYKITYTTLGTDTCKINSASVTESSNTLKVSINATCACADLQTCKGSNADKGTDTDRAYILMKIYGTTSATYTFGSITGKGTFRDIICSDSSGSGLYPTANSTVTSYSNGWLRLYVGYGRTSTVNNVSVTVSKIVIGSTTIYNGGFVSY